jgi:hypothetical protein
MLRIPTALALSPIEGAGLGLFTKVSILRDTLIWQFDEGKDFRVLEWPEDDPVLQEFLSHYGYRPIDGTPGWVCCSDNARFMNHQEKKQASCYVLPDGRTYAAYDLRKGTELTHDYNTFCASDPWSGWKNGDGALLERERSS